MNYNPEQIAAFTRYGKIHGIKTFTLHAYKAEVGIVDEDGYTKAHNADVGEATSKPENLGPTIQNLLLDCPGTDVTISSRVYTGKADCEHMAMLDLVIPFNPNDVDQHDQIDQIADLNVDIDRYGERIGLGTLFGPGTIYTSGNSFHMYGLTQPPMHENNFSKLVAAMLVCDHDKIADHAWLGFSLARGDFRLRLTAVQAKYKSLPAMY